MTERPLNLVPQRGPSVWDRPSPAHGWTIEESEKWCVTLCGGTLALVGLRQRTVGGALLAALGGALAVRALIGHRDLWNARGFLEGLRDPIGPGDQVDAASDDSFPASDAPPWTSTAGGQIP